MPRYRFDLTDGICFYADDDEGVSLRDLEAARRYAIRDIHDLVRHRPRQDWTGWRIEITDTARRKLLIVRFCEALGGAEDSEGPGKPG